MTHPILTEAYTAAETTLEDLEALLARTSDADIHRAHPQGGWTCSQVVTHISLSGITLIALLERLRHRAELTVYEEELALSGVTTAPATAEEARRLMASLRLALHDCLLAADPAVLSKPITMPSFGSFTLENSLVPIIGHITDHRDQIRGIFEARKPPAS